MAEKHGALVVFGSGPGVGRNVAALFAERGFKKVILMSRDAERLQQDAAYVKSSSSTTGVYEIPIDLSDSRSIESSLQQVNSSLEDTPLECVLYNAARTAKSQFFDFDPESLASDLRITVVSLYSVAQWAMPRLLQNASSNSNMNPSLVVTSGMLAKDPFPAMFSLAASKAGQHSLVHSLHKEYESKGVHCSLIVIGGFVSQESKVTNPRNIAQEAWKVLDVPRGDGKLETIMMDPAFEQHTKNREK